jgi:hypothetical protein
VSSSSRRPCYASDAGGPRVLWDVRSILIVTDEGAGLPRTTLDVDAIAEITSYAEYTASNAFRALGFSEDTSEGAPLCRWVHSGTIFDVMPLDEKILGFSNRSYGAAMEAATTPQLVRDLGYQGCDCTVLPRHENRGVLRIAGVVISGQAMIWKI